ncbi:hypothetical protein AV530_016953 [Patagioenas fasciata monilis]|uniref:Uncharacterized protein n=1 Tax=Patagioenas fasciata monilis TaxID=372326 RepID=A0A1V4J476_PATFA|nr:hypothetical protein AV530_016953 [Patagioenas fasciata monilis]
MQTFENTKENVENLFYLQKKNFTQNILIHRIQKFRNKEIFHKFLGLCRTIVGMKINFPADRTNPVAAFVCAGPLLPWNSVGMSGCHAKLLVSG